MKQKQNEYPFELIIVEGTLSLLLGDYVFLIALGHLLLKRIGREVVDGMVLRQKNSPLLVFMCLVWPGNTSYVTEMDSLLFHPRFSGGF